MPELMETADELGPEKILHVYDPAVGMKAVIVVDTTVFGRAGGGTRMLPDITTEEIICLARAMTYKYAILDLPVGGAKAGIWADPDIRGAPRDAIFRAFGKALKPLLEAGIGVGADLGTYSDDFAIMREGAGLPSRVWGLSSVEKDGEPTANHVTGYGVVAAAKAACEFADIELRGATVAIEGFGKVGGGVARYMTEEGARVVAISTLNGTAYNEDGLDIKKLLEVRKKSGDKAVAEYEAAQHIDGGEIYFLPVDILVPGARPYVIDKNNVGRVQARVISSGANIPVTDEAVESLFQRGICFVPDFISNAGAVMSGPVAQVGGTLDDIFRVLTEVLGQLTRDILTEARKEGVSPRSLAVRRCREKVLKARAEKESALSDEERLKLYRQRFKI